MSPTQEPRILILDDEPAAREALEVIVRDRLRPLAPQVIAVATPEEALLEIQKADEATRPFHAYFVDLANRSAQTVPGAEFLDDLYMKGRRDILDKTVVLSAYVSRSGEKKWAEEGLPRILPNKKQREQWGVRDVIPKPTESAAIHRVLEHLCGLPRQSVPRLRLNERSKVQNESVFEPIAGKAPSLRTALEKALLVAKTRASVLIIGESGTGKEMLANAIHKLSRRTGGIHRINVSAVQESLWESEFFGHRKGAFTGATEDRKGYLELADNGTLFLDEIGELPAAFRPKFLRFLEEGEFRPVGSGGKIIKTSARFISATDKTLAQLRALDDALFYRLSETVIKLPSMRQRFAEDPEEFDVVFGHVLKELRADDEFVGLNLDPEEPLTDGARRRLSTHTWPGNYRTFRNTVKTIARGLDGRRQIQATDVDDALLLTAEDMDVEVAQDISARTQTASDPAHALLTDLSSKLEAEGVRTKDLGDKILDWARYRVFLAMHDECDGDAKRVGERYRFGETKSQAHTNVRNRMRLFRTRLESARPKRNKKKNT